jgi:hypothetical protein
MSATNQNLFSTLIEFVRANEVQIRGADEIRFIKSNVLEKRIIKHLKIECREKIIRSIEFAIGKLESNFFLIVVGPPIPEKNIGEIFEFVSMDAGWFTTIISEMDVGIAPGVSAYEVADMLNDRYRNAPSPYEGHHFSDISHFFNPVSVFLIPSTVQFQENNLHRIAGTFLCARQEFLNLDISQDLIKEYEKLFIEGPDNLPFEELLDSLTSLRWKDAFLDVYRCIERLFPYSYVQSLHIKTAAPKPLEELIGIVEDVLGWKAKEDLALDTIFSACGHSEECLFRNVKKKLFGNEDGRIGIELVYKLRNSIVHHRLRGDRIYKRIEMTDWISLIKGLLMVMKNEYSKYHGVI